MRTSIASQAGPLGHGAAWRSRIDAVRIGQFIGRLAVALIVVAAVIGLDRVLPPDEHVDVRWLALLLAVFAAAYTAGTVLALIIAVGATAAIEIWLVAPLHPTFPPPFQDLIALLAFLVAAIVGAVAIVRSLPESPGSRRMTASVAQVALDPLTTRELTILDLLARGLSNDEIASALVVSRNTVKTHLEHLYGKLDVQSRGRAVAEGRRRGLLG